MKDFPESLPAGAGPKEAAAWVRKIAGFVGLGFHPDTPFSEYVKVDDGSRSFTRLQCTKLQRSLDAAWEILSKNDIDIYSIGLREQRRLLSTR